MSFLRPDIQRHYAHWRDVIWLGLAVIGLIYLTLSANSGFALRLVLGVLCVAFLAAFFIVLGNKWLSHTSRAVGEVMVDERQITYYIYGDGYAISVDDLVEIRFDKIRSNRFGNQYCWVLCTTDGTVLKIPTGAHGAAALPGALAARANLPYATLLLALQKKHSKSQVLWRAS